ncbi:hypothetical protein [Kribbella kalugense]|uniref:hypothetical protein n=1 Tax=Kribbella kalugense TaxID=2512221 RepID=UPI001416F0E3|nr:hypothetical protein [Kribbella kalugense]
MADLVHRRRTASARSCANRAQRRQPRDLADRRPGLGLTLCTAGVRRARARAPTVHNVTNRPTPARAGLGRRHARHRQPGLTLCTAGVRRARAHAPTVHNVTNRPASPTAAPTAAPTAVVDRGRGAGLG